MIRMHKCLAILLLLVLIRAGFAAAGAQTLADFEDGSTAVKAKLASAQVQSGDGAPQGKHFLRISTAPDADTHAYVRLPLPREADFVHHDRLFSELRATSGRSNLKLRWLALDEHGRPIFQRRFELQPGEKWITLDEPLRLWRWDNRFVGDWSEVRELVLRIESAGAGQIDLDDVRLDGDAATPGKDRAEWLMQLAFENRPTKQAQKNGLLIATDAIDGFAQQDLTRLADQIAGARAFIRRVFAGAVHPTDDLGPVTLLIFSNDADDRAFFDRLAQAWRVGIAPSRNQGYTVQDIATSTYRKELGTDRPVYLHEAVHAIVSRDLRLLTSDDPDTPLQEGLANYLQLCVFPKSLSRQSYVSHFAKPIDPSGGGFFKPLEQLFASRATTREYAQLASVIAYLVEKDQPLLRDLSEGLSAGESATQVLARRGTSWEQFQAAWLAWGQAKFNPAAGADADAPAFDPPPELR